ncbi:MAG: PT domain-containing protein, partial [Propionibacteriaceae bacterium]|nr:PT domain-containing protein [Propionibacteriaceae bacterium]
DDEAAAAILDSAAAAPDYAESGPVAAAKTAVAAAAAGRDPRDFGGLDLVQLIADGTDPATGQVGPYGYAFGQALAILALQRAGAAVPDAAVDYLLTFQDAAGAFGFSFGGAFSPDPDSTALALMALAETGQTEAVSRAVAWAAANQTAEGYWDGFSPIDSTGLLGGALAEQGVDVSAAAAWLAAQQLADGGFPNGLGLTESNAMTTANALYLLSGRTYATASTALAGCPTEPTAEPTSEPTAEPTGEPTAGPTGEPTDEPTGQPTLPDTGGPAGQGPFGAAGLVLLILGGVLLKMARAVSPAPLR